MSKPLSPDQFEAQANASVARKQSAQADLLLSINSLDASLENLSSNPSPEQLAEAVKIEAELSARKALASRISNNFIPAQIIADELNTPAGRDVLLAFHADKQKINEAIRAKLKPARQAASNVEESDPDLFEEMTTQVNALARLIEDHDRILHATKQQLARFPQEIDGASLNYRSIKEFLESIQP